MARADERLAKSASVAGLKRRYTDLADSYRMMAGERRLLINQGATMPDPGEEWAALRPRYVVITEPILALTSLLDVAILNGLAMFLLELRRGCV